MYLIHINVDVSYNFGRKHAVICENGFWRIAISVLIMLRNSNKRAASHILCKLQTSFQSMYQILIIYVEIVDAY